MSEPKDKNFLQRLKQKVSPQSALAGIAGSFLPQLGAQLEAMSQPIEQGGVLREGETKAAYLILNVKGDLTISIVPIAQDPETGRMYINKPIKTFTGDEAFSALNQ